MSIPRHFVSAEPGQLCVSIIGMAGCGKSTIGKVLAAHLGWAHLDTDHLIEASYGVPLQELTDTLSRQEFLDVEDEVIRALRCRRTIISTGGSVIYSSGAMQHLGSLGPILHLDVALPVILERIARHPDRGLVIAPGQTVQDLFAERDALYRQWATHTVCAGERPSIVYALAAAELLCLHPGEPALCAV